MDNNIIQDLARLINLGIISTSDITDTDYKEAVETILNNK